MADEFRHFVTYGKNGFSKDPNGYYFGLLYKETSGRKHLQSKSEKILALHKKIERLEYVKQFLDSQLGATGERLLNEYKLMLSELSYYDEDDPIRYTVDGRRVHDRQQSYSQRIKQKLQTLVFDKLKPYRDKICDANSPAECKTYIDLYNELYEKDLGESFGVAIYLDVPRNKVRKEVKYEGKNR